MIRQFTFDYDAEHDSLFIYDPDKKSKASIEFQDVIIDFTGKKEISGLEFLNASTFLKEMNSDGMAIDKKILCTLTACTVEVIPKGTFLAIKCIFSFASHKAVTAPIIVPAITEPSPAIV